MSDSALSVNARALSALLQAQTEGFNRGEVLLALVGTLGGFLIRHFKEPRPSEIENFIDLCVEVGNALEDVHVPAQDGN
jgi:hypothetical protein